MNFQPEYRSFQKRVWHQVNKTILLFIFIVMFLFILLPISILSVLYGLLLVIFILIFRVSLVHRYFLKQIEIDDKVQHIRIIIFKYNKLYKVYFAPYRDIRISIEQVFFSLRPYYCMKIYKNDNLILKQYECNSWGKNDMYNVYNEFKRLKKNL